MTPEQLKQARRKLGLNLGQMAVLLGYETPTGKSQIQHMEAGRRPIMPAQRRLIELYLAGVRPPDWPI
jgi:transcriptional regulator with XRE-family HTH domain